MEENLEDQPILQCGTQNLSQFSDELQKQKEEVLKPIQLAKQEIHFSIVSDSRHPHSAKLEFDGKEETDELPPLKKEDDRSQRNPVVSMNQIPLTEIRARKEAFKEQMEANSTVLNGYFEEKDKFLSLKISPEDAQLRQPSLSRPMENGLQEMTKGRVRSGQRSQHSILGIPKAELFKMWSHEMEVARRLKRNYLFSKAGYWFLLFFCFALKRIICLITSC